MGLQRIGVAPSIFVRRKRPHAFHLKLDLKLHSFDLGVQVLLPAL
jgi:hypothetical protein